MAHAMAWSRRLSALAALASTAAIVGCASPPAAAPESAETQPAAPQAAAESPPRPAGVPPDVNLSGPLLFQIMAAEVALQRGDTGAAFATYLSVARATRDARLARRATEIAVGGRAAPQALEAAQLWRELDPASNEAAQAVTALLVANGRYDEAATALAAQIKAAADPAAELARVQRSLARAPDRAAGFALLEKLAQPYRDDPKIGADVRLVLAGGAHAAGLAPRAIELAQSALALRPDFERAALTAAQLIARPEGKDDAAGRARALQLLQDFLARNPQALDARMGYARLLVADAKYDEARAQFAQVVGADERNLDALYALAVLSLETPALRADARRLFERYLKLLEESPGVERDPDPAYLNLARIAEEEKRYPEALQWLDRIDGGDQYVNARVRRALVLGKMKRVEEGRKVLAETPVNSNEERTQVVLAEAQLLREAKRHRDAFDVLAQGLARAPDDAGLLYDAAMAAERLDKLDVMEGHLRQLIKLRPDYAHAYNALGYTFADRNIRLQEARELIEKALHLAPEDGYILDSMGWVYFRLGDLARAREYLERAYKLKPEAEVAAHLGEVMWAQGERDAARRLWREYWKKEPDNETLKATLVRLKVKL
ncbi:tetratricopeptide repeat protein [Betaproteobacteria bacterium PRO7]|nr:tetratricopeptide repeat protein [Betaproteobacteria bacterium PRO7]